MKGPGYCYGVTYWSRYNKPEYSHVKIGYFTTKEIEQVIHNNYSRILTPLCVICIVPCVNALLGESWLHNGLESVRRDPRHEIFDLTGKVDLFYQIIDMIVKLNVVNGKQLNLRYNIDWQKWAFKKKLVRIQRKLSYTHIQNVQNTHENCTQILINIEINDNEKDENKVKELNNSQIKELKDETMKINEENIKKFSNEEEKYVYKFVNKNIILTNDSYSYLTGKLLWEKFNKWRESKNIFHIKKTVLFNYLHDFMVEDNYIKDSTINCIKVRNAWSNYKLLD